jgi:transposase
MDGATVRSLAGETEVTEKAKRRSFSAEYKRRVVKEADACKGSGAIGALLRREGLYSSQLADWRAARDRGELAPGDSTKKRGPRAASPDPRDKLIAEKDRQIATLTARAERAEAITEIQKKLSQLLGLKLPDEES